MALHAMGKLYEDMINGKGFNIKSAAPKAMVCYQAALMVFAENYMAANDVGVLLARNGNFEGACRLLEYSLSLNKNSSVWHNLAVVYEHLGRGDQARIAELQANIARQGEKQCRQQLFAGSSDRVRWVPESEFAENGAPPSNMPQLTPIPPVNQLPQQAASPPANQPPRTLQPLANPNGTAQGVAAQPAKPVNSSLPVMRPAATSMLPKSPSESSK